MTSAMRLTAGYRCMDIRDAVLQPDSVAGHSCSDNINSMEGNGNRLIIYRKSNFIKKEKSRPSGGAMRQNGRSVFHTACPLSIKPQIQEMASWF